MILLNRRVLPQLVDRTFVRSVFSGILFAFLSSNFFLLSARADDQVARELLTRFWSHTLKKKTDAYFLDKGKGDKDSIYAYALVKSRQHDVQKALKAIDALHKLSDFNPQSWRLKSWLLLRKDEFNQAALATEKYIAAIKKDKTLDDFRRTDAYRFAGRVFGFLEGPVKSKTQSGTVEIAKQKILFKLDPDLINAFTFEYSQVETQYQKMMQAKQRHDTDFAVKDAAERKIKFAQLEKLENQLDQSREKLNQQSGDIRDQATQELDAIREQDIPLAEQQEALESDLYDINCDLIATISDYNYWNNRAFRERHPRQRANFFRRAGRMDGLIIQQELAASRLRNEIRSILAERMELRRQYSETNAIASSELNSIQQQLKQVNREQKITFSKKLRTTKPTRKIITRSVSLKTKAHSIVTYDQFPLEIERQLLLDRLK